MRETIFDGRIAVDLTTGETMKLVALRKNLIVAVSEIATWNKEDEYFSLFANLVLILGRTRSVKVVDPSESDPVICDLMRFWEFASNSNDYRAIWNAFLMLDIAVNEEFVAVINRVDAGILKAPKLVQPGAPTDEQLEGLLNGANLS